MNTLTAPTAATRHLEITRPDGTVGRIAYDDQGTGPVVLLAPGMGTVRATFRHLTPLLLAAGYRVVTTDYRGLGESDTGWDTYSSAATADDLAALIQHLDAGPVLLYGNSYTAASSVHLAAEHPELLRGVVLAGPFVRSLPAPNVIAKALAALMTRPALTRPLWMVWFPHMFPKRPADYAAMRAAVDAGGPPSSPGCAPVPTTPPRRSFRGPRRPACLRWSSWAPPTRTSPTPRPRPASPPMPSTPAWSCSTATATSRTRRPPSR
ncbi:alpha/beta fold hydrolase [Actinospica durhamensis]|uniref:Alpha/beta fold hydrolase n=1 Tax=Actinospica durhamensis TaxID=1508375 RepID=A0A941EUH9_9ACTN|nr:alpha/beta fold hydrolase [Actinospica durhamensis]MBR7837246.1 alpha/beta fold hydrolase [Actinospica durhamensis]